MVPYSSSDSESNDAANSVQCLPAAQNVAEIPETPPPSPTPQKKSLKRKRSSLSLKKYMKPPQKKQKPNPFLDVEAIHVESSGYEASTDDDDDDDKGDL